MPQHNLTRNEALLIIELLMKEADRIPTVQMILKPVDPTGSERRRNRRKLVRLNSLRERLWREAVLHQYGAPNTTGSSK